MKKLIIPLAVIIVALVFSSTVFGSVGVGVGSGKIQISHPLKPGLIYTIPPLTVINTGDEPAEYTASVDYSGKQTELKPDKGWFVFEPAQFHLDPGMSQVVQIKLTLPVNARPGDYFAFLQGQPASKVNTIGGTTVGVAAAAKLYFSVVPANIFQGIYYRLASFINNSAPWSYVILAVVVAGIILTLFRRYFSFDIGLKKKNEKRNGS